MRRIYAMAALIVVHASAVGCAGGPDEIPPDAYPTLMALVAEDGTPLEAAAVGETIKFDGTRFVASGQGWVDVTFRGEYHLDDGTKQQVDLTIPLQATSSGEIKWQFGGWRIPFTEGGNQLGTFHGNVYATNRFFEQDYKPQQPADTWPLVTLRVKPSLIVQDFRAMGETWVASSCRWPAPNVIGSVPYALRVRAVGFQPTRYDFTMSRGLLVEGQPIDGEHTITKMSSETEYAVLVRYADVPEHSTGYRGSVYASAYGTDGVEYKVLYPFVVRRPVQAFITSGRIPAQRYTPVETVSCINGGVFPITTSYSESKSETATRGITKGVDRSWNRSMSSDWSETRGNSESVGESNGISTSTTIALTESEGASETNTSGFSHTDSLDDVYSLSLTNMRQETDSSENGTSAGSSTSSSGTSSSGNSTSGSSTSSQGSSASANNTLGWYVQDESGNRYSYNNNGQVTGSRERENDAQAGASWAPGQVKVERQITRGYAGGSSNGVDTHGLSTRNVNGNSSAGAENSAGYSETNGNETSSGQSQTVGGESSVGATSSRGYSNSNGSQDGQTWGRTTGYADQETSSRAEGRSWERAQTYSETVGATNTSTWEYTNNYSQSVGESETIGEQIGESESELLQTSSSSTVELGVSGQIWAGAFGSWYRQKTRFIQFVSFVEYDLCGNGHERARSEMNDYTWAVGLAVGNECSPAPRLPPAACLVDAEMCEDDQGDPGDPY